MDARGACGPGSRRTRASERRGAGRRGHTVTSTRARPGLLPARRVADLLSGLRVGPNRSDCCQYLYTRVARGRRGAAQWRCAARAPRGRTTLAHAWRAGAILYLHTCLGFGRPPGPTHWARRQRPRSAAQAAGPADGLVGAPTAARAGVLTPLDPLGFDARGRAGLPGPPGRPSDPLAPLRPQGSGDLSPLTPLDPPVLLTWPGELPGQCAQCPRTPAGEGHAQCRIHTDPAQPAGATHLPVWAGTSFSLTYLWLS